MDFLERITGGRLHFIRRTLRGPKQGNILGVKIVWNDTWICFDPFKITRAHVSWILKAFIKPPICESSDFPKDGYHGEYVYELAADCGKRIRNNFFAS